MKKGKTLFITSYGMEAKHITLETRLLLNKCGVVFSPSLDCRSQDLLTTSFAKFECLRGLSSDEMAGKVKTAFLAHDMVGFITFGNPLFLNSTGAVLNREMAIAGIRVKSLPAVSSFDCIANLMDFNKFASDGLRLVDIATAKGEAKFTPGMDTLFFMAGQLNLKSNKKYRKTFLRGLEESYPGGHSVRVINCPSIGNATGRRITTTVSKLYNIFSKVDDASTILVYAIK